MRAATSVVLYGSSLLLAGIEAELRSRGQLRVVVIAADGRDAAARIAACDAAAVVFDLAGVQPDFAFALLRERPGLPLIGVDPSSDNMPFFCGRRARAVTTADLIQVITGH